MRLLRLVFEMAAKFAAVVLLISIGGCGADSYYAYEVQVRKFDAWDGPYYFQKNDLVREGDRPMYGKHDLADDHANHSFSYYLSGMDEPVLSSLSPGVKPDQFRLTIVYSDSGPTTYRAGCEPENCWLIERVGNVRVAGWGPVTSVSETRIEIDLEGFERLFYLARTKVSCRHVPDDTVGVDGSEWALEVIHKGQFCANYQWSPHSGGWRELLKEILIALGNDRSEVEERMKYT